MGEENTAYYTDYDIITAIAEGYLTEYSKTGRGRPPKPARDEADATLKLLAASDRGMKVPVERRLFLEMHSTDALLAAWE